jgi:cation:H+ antiporter
MINLLWLLLGLGLLVVGGEGVVRGALSAARRLGVSPLLAGLVIVGFGTSAPELVVSVKAAFDQQPDIALGNVIGSNISNMLLILGVSALIMPMTVHIKSLQRDGLTMLGATLLFILLASFGGLTQLDGALLLVCLVVYLTWAYRSERDHEDLPSAQLHKAEAEEFAEQPLSVGLTWLYLVGGLALLLLGADRFLVGAVGLGQMFGVPEAIIGLTVVAVGTSLPELAVSVVAAIRRHADVAIGNVLGSNIFNLLSILGIASLLQPLPMQGRLMEIDQWVMLGVSVLLLGFLFFGLQLSRLKGAALLVVYAVYVGSMFFMQ